MRNYNDPLEVESLLRVSIIGILRHALWSLDSAAHYVRGRLGLPFLTGEEREIVEAAFNECVTFRHERAITGRMRFYDGGAEYVVERELKNE
jgi:hypothetical protein